MLSLVRKLFGYTQEDLSSRVGVTQNYYTQIETGSSRSTPLIDRISKELKIKESFLTSSGEYPEYPFLDNFYIFYLPERRIVQSYKFFLDYICSPSKYVDVVFFFTRQAEYRLYPYSSIAYIALRDDHDSVFLLKKPTKTMPITRDEKENILGKNFNGGTIDGYAMLSDGKVMIWEAKQQMRNMIFSFVDIFREELHKLQTTYVYEKTVRIGANFLHAVEKGEITRDNILAYFPTEEYMNGLCMSRRKN